MQPQYFLVKWAFTMAKVHLSSLLITSIYHPILPIAPYTSFVQSDAAALFYGS